MSDTNKDEPIVRVTDYVEAFVRGEKQDFTAERPAPGTLHLYPKQDFPKNDDEMVRIAEELDTALFERFEEDVVAERLPDGPIEVVVESEAN